MRMCRKLFGDRKRKARVTTTQSARRSTGTRSIQYLQLATKRREEPKATLSVERGYKGSRVKQASVQGPASQAELQHSR